MSGVFERFLKPVVNETPKDIVEFTKEIHECFEHGNVMHRVTVWSDGSKDYECLSCINSQTERSKQKEQEQIESDKEEKRIRQIDFYKSCNIEPEFYDFTFDDFKPKTSSQQKAKEAVLKMINQKHGKVFLLGSNGLGKTMLATLAVKELGGKIYSMYEITTMIRQSYTSRAIKTELEIVEELASIPFLAIDELGRSKGGDTEQNWLSYILNKRHTRRLPFMLLSNGHFKSTCPEKGCSRCIENFIDSDVMSRLKQDSEIILMTGPDERTLHTEVE